MKIHWIANGVSMDERRSDGSLMEDQWTMNRNVNGLINGLVMEDQSIAHGSSMDQSWIINGLD